MKKIMEVEEYDHSVEFSVREHGEDIRIPQHPHHHLIVVLCTCHLSADKAKMGKQKNSDS